MKGFTLDAGALIAVERHAEKVRAVLRKVEAAGAKVQIPAGALAQAWRDDPHQHALRVLLKRDHVDVVSLDLRAALAAGALCGASSTHDVIDASVVVCAREHGSVVITSDPDDISTLAPELELMTV